MKAGEEPHHLVLPVQNRVAPVAALKYHLLHVIQVVVQEEVLQILPPADPGDGQGLKDAPHRLVGIVGGGDDAGIRVLAAQILGELCLTEDNAVDAGGHRRADDVRLLAADQHCVLPLEGDLVDGQGLGDDHPAGDGVDHVGRFVEQFPLQDAKDVEDGHIL